LVLPVRRQPDISVAKFVSGAVTVAIAAAAEEKEEENEGRTGQRG
jgi:hypothetical protein